MKEPKIIVLDIDGTLYNDYKEIMPLTKEALMKAQKQGCILVLASGRPASGLYYIASELEMEKYHGLLLCFNGSQIIDLTNQEILFNAPMTIEKAKKVLHHVKKFDVNPMVYKENNLYVEDRNAYMADHEAKLAGLNMIEVDNLEAYLDWETNKVLTSGQPEYLRKVYSQMKEPFDDLNCMFTAPFYYEYTMLGIDKAKALDIALQKIGYDATDCISFGDAQNDISIIRYASIGVAMGNASDDVKKEADEITLDNNHEGIYHMLKKYISFI